MMQFTLPRNAILKPLQQVIGVVEKKQTLPILSHVLISLKNNVLRLTGTDLEIELIANYHLDVQIPDFDITVPAKKLMDICRSLPDDISLQLSFDDYRLTIQAGRSRFQLATLPANDFPRIDLDQPQFSFQLAQNELKLLLEKTHFAIAQQDVRFYLNGLLFDLNDGLNVIGTDGHRLAYAKAVDKIELPHPHQIIVPRKAVLELIRLLNQEEESLTVAISSNHLHIMTADFTFVTKLIDSKYPDYRSVIPSQIHFSIAVEKSTLKQALMRASILANEKHHSVKLTFKTGQLEIQATNAEQEEAIEEVEIDYQGDELEIGFNVLYLLDALNALPDGTVKLLFNGAYQSMLIQHQDVQDCLYVVMPVRL